MLHEESFVRFLWWVLPLGTPFCVRSCFVVPSKWRHRQALRLKMGASTLALLTHYALSPASV